MVGKAGNKRGLPTNPPSCRNLNIATKLYPQKREPYSEGNQIDLGMTSEIEKVLLQFCDAGEGKNIRPDMGKPKSISAL